MLRYRVQVTDMYMYMHISQIHVYTAYMVQPCTP